MELEFQKNTREYLRCISGKCAMTEVSADCVITDQSPDLVRVISANACACTREKQCREHCAAVNGGIRVSVLYEAEGSPAPQKLDAYIPFSVREEQEDVTERTQIRFSCDVQSPEIRILNSRKISIHIPMAYSMSLYQPCSFTEYSPSEPPECLQLRTETYPLHMMTDFAERAFTVSDAIVFPAGKPLGETFCYANANAEITEQRLAGNKAVFKGVVYGRGVYLSDQGELCQAEVQIPFSQYCEMEQREDGELSVQLLVADCDWQISEDRSYAELALNLVAQCSVRSAAQVCVTEDAYCIGHRLDASWETVELDTVLSEQKQSYAIHAHGDCDATEICDVQIHIGQPYFDGDGLLMLPTSADVLFKNGLQQIESVTVKSVQPTSIRNSAETDADVTASQLGTVSAVTDAGGVDLRYTIGTEEKIVTLWKKNTMTGGTAEPVEQDHHAAVLVRFVRDGESLWEIAKSCNTTVSEICAANRLDESETPAGMLLIPM